MRTSLILILPLLLAAESCASLAIGDLALIGWESRGKGGLTYVTLADIAPGETIFFTDNEPTSDGEGFNSKEGTLQLTTGPSTITAGTVIVFTQPSGKGISSSVGTLSQPESKFKLSPSRDGLWVYQTGDTGTYDGTVSNWVSATASTAGFGHADVGSIPDGSGLVSGVNALDVTSKDNSFQYTGDRSIPRTKDEWLIELSSPGNFGVGSGGSGGSTASFSMVPEPGTVLPLAALLTPWFLRRRRR